MSVCPSTVSVQPPKGVLLAITCCKGNRYTEKGGHETGNKCTIINDMSRVLMCETFVPFRLNYIYRVNYSVALFSLKIHRTTQGGGGGGGGVFGFTILVNLI